MSASSSPTSRRPTTPAPGSSTVRSKTRAPNSAARNATSRRSISPRTRSTTSCASACSSRCPTRRRSRTSPQAYGRKLEEAAKSKTANRGAEAIADEIAATYPFHPRLKNVIALFKENEQFKQTRGLIELVSRLLRSVWERQANDVFLIGPQHFDLGNSGGPRQADRDLRHARRDRQGPLGRAAFGPRPGHRPADRQGGRDRRSARCCSPPASPPRSTP